MRLALVSYSFPEKSETFIFDKVRLLSEEYGNKNVKLFIRSEGGSKKSERRLINCSLLPKLSGSKLIVFPKALLYISRYPIYFIFYLRKYRHWGLRKAIHLFPIVKYNPDIIQLEWASLFPMYSELFQIDVKIAVSCRGSDIFSIPLTKPSYVSIYKQCFRRVAGIQTHGPTLQNALLKNFDVHPSQITIIPTSRRFTQFKKMNNLEKNERFTVITVARLDWKKGHVYALQACSKLIKLGYEMQYHIVGGGVLEEYLRFEAHDLQIEDSIQFFGWVPPSTVNELLNKSHLFVLPSISEGMPNALIEAMAVGLPAIVSDTGSSDAIIDGKTGYVFRRRDVDQLAEKIKWVIDNPLEASRVAEKGFEHVILNHNIEDKVKLYNAFYRRMLNN